DPLTHLCLCHPSPRRGGAGGGVPCRRFASGILPGRAGVGLGLSGGGASLATGYPPAPRWGARLPPQDVGNSDPSRLGPDREAQPSRGCNEENGVAAVETTADSARRGGR